MAVICLTSASGSPGVTTTAVGPRVLLATPGAPRRGRPHRRVRDPAGFLRGTTPYDAGLVELALSPLGAAEALRDVVRPLSPSVSFVAGTRTHTQAAALREVWEPLAIALAELEANGQDVIVDAGRLGLAGSPKPLLDTADATLLVTRATLPSLSAASSWAETSVSPRPDGGTPASSSSAKDRPTEPPRSPRCLACPWSPTFPTIRRPPRSTTAERIHLVASRAAPTSARSGRPPVRPGQIARGRFDLVEEAAR